MPHRRPRPRTDQAASPRGPTRAPTTSPPPVAIIPRGRRHPHRPPLAGGTDAARTRTALDRVRTVNADHAPWGRDREALTLGPTGRGLGPSPLKTAGHASPRLPHRRPPTPAPPSSTIAITWTGGADLGGPQGPLTPGVMALEPALDHPPQVHGTTARATPSPLGGRQQGSHDLPWRITDIWGIVSQGAQGQGS